MQERRQYRRVIQSFEARYRLYGELMESWRRVRTMNIGAGGIRFRSADLIEPGTKLEIEVSLPSLPAPIRLSGIVIWTETMASGVTENGTEFVDVTPEQGEQIDELVKFLHRG